MNKSKVASITATIVALLGILICLPGGVLLLPPFAYFSWVHINSGDITMQAGPLGACNLVPIPNPWTMVNNWSDTMKSNCALLSGPTASATGASLYFLT